MRLGAIRWSIAVAVPVLLSACDPPGPTVTIPSDACNEGVGDSDCVVVPPVTARAWDVDGERSQHEYWGAYTLPYDNPGLEIGGGTVFVTIEDDNVAGNPENLHIFLEDIPLSTGGTTGAFTVPTANEVVVYLDDERFVTKTSSPTSEDAAYAINVFTGSRQFRRPQHFLGATTWQASTPVPPWDAAVGDCDPIPGGFSQRCDIEFEIEIPAPFTPTADVDRPGIGIGIADDVFWGAMPEQMASTPGTDTSVDRQNYQTLLFTEPNGFPFKFMSWNVRRFSSTVQTLKGDSFSDVALLELAVLIAENDVVALQELWDPDDARTLLEVVNDIREFEGLEPMRMYGPPRAAPDLLEQIQQSAIPLNGGVYIFSKYPKIAGDYDVYSECRDLDCIKAKGAMWVRLAVNPPTPASADPMCRDGVDVPGCDRISTGAGTVVESACQPRPPGANCPPEPTSEYYVNVFNTHLQAGSDDFCGNEELINQVLNLVIPNPGFPDTFLGSLADISVLDAVFRENFHCGRDPDEVQRAQLEQFGQFVNDRLEGAGPRHLSIIAGDFNINGRNLGASESDPTYQELLAELGITSTLSDADAPDDLITPLPDAFDWDIDHGDVARETRDDDFWVDEGFGTSIGGDDGDDREPPACTSPEDNRPDYIIARPAFPADDPAHEYPFYTLKRPTDDDDDGASEPVWQSPWPELGSPSCGSPPDRLSDHRPIVGLFEIVRLREPPRYHPNRAHEFDFRVTSVDARGSEDCWRGQCNPVDPYVRLIGRKEMPGGIDLEFVNDRAPGTCDSRWTMAFPGDDCMELWSFPEPDVQIPTVNPVHRAGAELHDEDFSSSDDNIPTIEPGRHPLFSLRWANGLLTLRDLEDPSVTPDGWEMDYHVFNNDAVQECTNNGEPKEMCTLISFEEVEP